MAKRSTHQKPKPRRQAPAAGRSRPPATAATTQPANASQGSPNPKPDVSNQARIIGAFGRTGTGKSYFTKQVIEHDAAPIAIVFDPGGEYGAVAFTDELKFLAAINTGAGGLVVLRPPFDADRRTRMFDRFCRVGLAIARARGRCQVVIDELHLVTEPGRAPAGWRELIETGRKFGVSVVAASIRPASIDKSFWTNCTHVRTGALNYSDDQKTLANCLGVHQDEVAALIGYQFILKNLLTGELVRG